ncbi:3-dehydroquinate synthase II [Sorangium sp. So ce1151]|uniref:3-dehydroquinate synthase II n=1 Tax=Sorangium sp. So ce1151 TaxID=3133332 RepID=UPI003F618C7D
MSGALPSRGSSRPRSAPPEQRSSRAAPRHATTTSTGRASSRGGPGIVGSTGRGDYLNGMRAGSKVLCADLHGNTRVVTVGRAEIERGPLLKIPVAAGPWRRVCAACAPTESRGCNE